MRALCSDLKVPIIEVSGRSELGVLVEQCVYDKEGNARKISKCSVAAVTDYAKESLGAEMENLLRTKGGATKSGGGEDAKQDEPKTQEAVETMEA